MGALQEARFYVIIWVIMLIGILGYFFTLQSNVGYTEYSTALKTTYADVKANASTTKSLRDVVTIDGSNIRAMKNNQLFGLTVDGVSATLADDLETFDKYTLGNALNVLIPSAGKMKVVYLVSDDAAAELVDAPTTAAPTGAAVTVGTKLKDATLGTPGTSVYDNVTSSGKGWTLDSNGYIAYIFESETKAKQVMNDFLPNGTLVKVKETAVDTTWVSAWVVVPFQSK